MRIAFLTHEPFFPPSGGGSAAAVYLVRELVARGHQVEVFGPTIADAAGVEQKFGIRLRMFTGWRMGRTTPLRTPKYLAYPRALAGWVERVIREGARYDLLVAQHSIAAVAAGRVKRRMGIPIVLNLLDCLTGFLETWPPYLMPRPVARALVRYELSLPRRCHADGVLTVSDGLRERVVANGYPADRVLAAYYGYDASIFRCGAASSPPVVGPPRIVMHGSFDHHHLGRIARCAFLEVVRRRPDVRFLMVGPITGALRAFLDSVRAIEPGIAIEAPGFTPYDQIPARLESSTIGITPYEPSTGTHCAFIAKTIEYLAMGLPVVSTPLEGAVRYYQGLEAVTFSGPLGEGFADGILRWLDLEPAARRARVEPARRKVAAELDWPVLCRRASAFLESCGTPR
ncbi:MAG: glycosyltransferase [Verrucomicrobiales bacterium]|nr:glycosyltransferase [Verrucomicrobiales bacterium]